VVQTEGFQDALGAGYRLLERRGRGAAGEVWRAVDRRTDGETRRRRSSRFDQRDGQRSPGYSDSHGPVPPCHARSAAFTTEWASPTLR
jgi:hypothetical protein